MLALVSEFNCFLRSRCSMEMWCPDDIGRDSWDWVGPPAWVRACFNSPEWGGGSSPVKKEINRFELLLLLLFRSVYSTRVYPQREQMQCRKNLITTPHARTWRRGLVQSLYFNQFPPGQNQDHDPQPPHEPSKTWHQEDQNQNLDP